MKTISIKILALSLIGVMLFSCEKEATITTVPEVPPAQTMAIDFSQWDNSTKSTAPNNSNWIFSATTVGVWNLIIGTTFAIPVAAFSSAIKHEATVVDDLTWQWQYTVDGFTSQYTARLIGKLQSTQVLWEMYISKTGVDSFDEFLWFEGTSAIDGKSGQWILYHSAQFPEKTIQIDWKIEGEDVAEIKYTYIRELNDIREIDMFDGSHLTYGLQESEWDIYVNIHAYDFQKKTFTDTNIEWNRINFNGHVKAEHYFGDTEWHCWDSEGKDMVCN